MRLHPPSRTEIRDNLRLFAADWQRAGAAMRYYAITHLLAHTGLLLCAAGSLAFWLAGVQEVQLGLLGAAAACGAQAALCWKVLRQRFRVRYELL